MNDCSLELCPFSLFLPRKYAKDKKNRIIGKIFNPSACSPSANPPFWSLGFLIGLKLRTISPYIKLPGEENEFGSTVIGNEGIKLFDDMLTQES